MLSQNLRVDTLSNPQIPDLGEHRQTQNCCNDTRLSAITRDVTSTLRLIAQIERALIATIVLSGSLAWLDKAHPLR